MCLCVRVRLKKSILSFLPIFRPFLLLGAFITSLISAYMIQIPICKHT